MKKLLLISLAATALLSCNKFEQEEAIKVDSETRLSIPVEMESILGSEETKAYLEDNGSSWSYVWEDGNAIDFYQLRRGSLINQGQAIVDKRPNTTNVVYPASDFRAGDAIYSYIGAAQMNNSNPRQMYLEIPDTQISSRDPEMYVYSEDFSFTIDNVNVSKLRGYDISGTQNAIGITPQSGKVEFKINGFKRGTEYGCSGDASNLQIDIYGNARCDVNFASFDGLENSTSYSVTSTIEVFVQEHPEEKATLQITAKANVTKEKKIGNRVLNSGKVSISYSKGNTSSLSLLLEHEITGDEKPYYVRDCMPCVTRQFSMTSQLLNYPTEIANNITFHMLGSAVQWKVYTTDENVGAGENLCGVIFNANKPCAGVGEYDIITGSLELENLTSSSILAYDEEELTIPYKESDNDYVSLYMVLAPGTYSAEVAFVTDQHVYVYNMANQNFSRAVKKSMSVNLASTSATILTLDEYFDPKPEDPSAYYVKLDSAPEGNDWNGTYLVVNAEGNKAFSAIVDDENTINYAVDVNAVNGMIASDGIVDKYAITVSGGIDNHGNNTSLKAYDVFNSNGNFIFYSQGQIKIQDNIHNIGDNDVQYSYRHTLKYDNGVQMMSSGIANGQNKYYIKYENGGFTYGRDETSNRVELYKLTDANDL